jgi:hypothetical protein
MLRSDWVAWFEREYTKEVRMNPLFLCADRAACQRDLKVESDGNHLALAIGNNAYSRGVLKNAVNDARGVADPSATSVLPWT